MVGLGAGRQGGVLDLDEVADVQVGSNCVLVAPMTVGDGATIGGGSTIAGNAPAGQLTVARAKQVTLPGWVRPKKGPAKGQKKN